MNSATFGNFANCSKFNCGLDAILYIFIDCEINAVLFASSNGFISSGFTLNSFKNFTNKSVFSCFSTTLFIRSSEANPILKDKGVKVEDEAFRPDSTAVFSFPIKSPTNAITRDDRTALQELETWLTYQRYWCEHKPSVTINVREHEWLEVGAWVYKHFDEISGISFLPHSDHSYVQAPYQEIDKETFRKALKETPQLIEFEELIEEDDNTEASQTLACTGNSCEIT